MSSVRDPAVAGAFYPADPGALRGTIDRLLAGQPADPSPLPKALIAPHAGYAYSGPTAAAAFGRVRAHKEAITRVVVIGPSHHVAFRGIAVPHAAAFRTPLGDVPVDLGAVRDLVGIMAADEPHRREHAIEVELPFLQHGLGEFMLVPLVVGDADEAAVERALEPLAADPATLIVVSSDLSHFLDHGAAVQRDRITAAAIERLDGASLGPAHACGYLPIRGWLALARRLGLSAERLDLRTSGDTAGGDRQSVVGYGAWTFA